jgi:hypothetical protein
MSQTLDVSAFAVQVGDVNCIAPLLLADEDEATGSAAMLAG